MYVPPPTAKESAFLRMFSGPTSRSLNPRGSRRDTSGRDIEFSRYLGLGALIGAWLAGSERRSRSATSRRCFRLQQVASGPHLPCDHACDEKAQENSGVAGRVSLTLHRAPEQLPAFLVTEGTDVDDTAKLPSSSIRSRAKRPSRLPEQRDCLLHRSLPCWCRATTGSVSATQSPRR